MAKNKIQYFNDLVTIQPTLYRIKDECKFCLHLKHSLLKYFSAWVRKVPNLKVMHLKNPFHEVQLKKKII